MKTPLGRKTTISNDGGRGCHYEGRVFIPGCIGAAAMGPNRCTCRRVIVTSKTKLFLAMGRQLGRIESEVARMRKLLEIVRKEQAKSLKTKPGATP